MVVSILAAISVVAYNGIQTRANSSKTESVIKAYQTALEMYYVDHGRYPATYNDNNDYLCLGQPSDFPADGDFALGQCSKNSNYSWGAVVVEDLNQALEPYMPNPPGALLKTYTWSSHGNTYWTRGVEAQVHDQWAYMEYFIDGSQSCPTGDKNYDEERGVTLCYVRMYSHL